MIRIAMDSAGDMPDGWGQEYDIQVIPVNIHWKDRLFLQGVDLSNEEFYTRVDQSQEIPKTSQPTPQQFVEFYKKIAEIGDTILSLHVTSKLSGTFSSAILAARELVGKYTIYPIDSYSGSAAMGYMCREARLMERAGKSVQTILDRLDYIRNNVNIVLTLDNLDYARMSGRVKALQAALASVLNVKPIVILRDGMLQMAEKVRTRQRSIEYVLETVRNQVGDRLVNVAVVHARDIRSGESLLEQVRKRLNCAEVILTDLSIGVAANLGPGTVGLVVYPVKD